MVGGAMVSASTGVMNSLMVKLATLKDEKKVRKETTSLKGELSSMEALLFKVATRDDPDVQAKEWTRQVREVGYDTEDCIDIYVQQRSAPAPDSKPPKLFRRLLDRRSSAKTPEFAEEITELTDRFKDANERHKRYKLENLGTGDDAGEPDQLGPSSAIIPTRLIYEEEPRLVAIDGRTMEVVAHLMEDREQQQLRVVSIHGFGGLGKTTLANEVYRELRGGFECHAFVYAGPNQHIRTTLLQNAVSSRR